MSNKMKAEELIEMIKAGDLFRKQQEEEIRKEKSHLVLWIFAVVGVVAAVATIAYALYLYFTPDYLEDFEEDFDDDFDDDFFEDDEEDDDDEVVEVKPAEPKKEVTEEATSEE